MFKHIALSVDVDRNGDAYLRKAYRNALTKADGTVVKVPGELRKLCAEYRAQGFAVFPPCDNHDERGYCLGHEEAEVGS